MVGKWYLGDNAPQNRGFQEILWHRCGGIGQASDSWGNDYFDDTYEHATADNRQVTFEKFEGDCTVVWFLSDHGGMKRTNDNRLLLGARENAFEGGIRVPFVVRWRRCRVPNLHCAISRCFAKASQAAKVLSFRFGMAVGGC